MKKAIFYICTILIGVVTVISIFIVVDSGFFKRKLRSIFINNSANSKSISYDNMFIDEIPPSNTIRIAPIYIKANSEWLFDKKGVKFIRLGFENVEKINNSEIHEYKPFSPKELSAATSKISIINSNSVRVYEKELYSYDIEVENNEIWLDIYLELENLYAESEKSINRTLSARRSFYIFHPKERKWFGLADGWAIKEIMYTAIFDESNEKHDVWNFLSKLRSQEEYNNVLDEIIENRTIILPSMEFYTRSIEPLTSRFNCSGWNIYSWYVEKKEPEKIDPKDKDE